MKVNDYKVCIYLRKSRKDLDQENKEGLEILKKHQEILLDLAKENNYKVIKTKKEVVSGESLSYRVEMLELLQEIKKGLYYGVMCMDLDRLGRGDMEEQGIILKAFRENNTKIITPLKTYNLCNEWDEDYSEFEAFMARKELKLITRRLQRGRIKSVEEGNYLGSKPPFGYEIKKDKGERYLVLRHDEAKVVKLIFSWYTGEGMEGRLGTEEIVKRLNSLGYKSPLGKNWNKGTVLFILKNPVYIGKIKWNLRDKKNLPGEYGNRKIEVEGKHHPLISEKLFLKAKDILKGNSNSKVPRKKTLINPLAGLVVCKCCQRKMVLRPYGKGKSSHLICYNNKCINKSAKYSYVEDKLLIVLEKWLLGYEILLKKYIYDKYREEKGTIKESSEKYQKMQQKAEINKKLRELKEQEENLYELLEKGYYSEVTFVNRKKKIESKINSLNEYYKELNFHNEANKSLKNGKNFSKKDLDNINILDIYYNSMVVKDKNSFLKKVLYKIEYKKEKHKKEDEFELILYPKLMPCEGEVDTSYSFDKGLNILK